VTTEGGEIAFSAKRTELGLLELSRRGVRAGAARFRGDEDMIVSDPKLVPFVPILGLALLGALVRV
jgi:hypothetical protein